ELLAKLLQIFDRITPFASGNVHHEKKNSAAGDVSQELVTEAETPVGAFNQSGNVRDRRPPIFGKFHHTDDWMQRCEWVGGDFRSRGGNFSEQSRFPGIRITNQTCVRDGP